MAPVVGTYDQRRAQPVPTRVMIAPCPLATATVQVQTAFEGESQNADPSSASEGRKPHGETGETTLPWLLFQNGGVKESLELPDQLACYLAKAT